MTRTTPDRTRDADENLRGDLRAIVRDRYGEAARQAASGALADHGPPTGESAAASCCGPEHESAAASANGAIDSSGCCGSGATVAVDPVTADIYYPGQTGELPAAALLASRGCGNPTAPAELRAQKSGRLV